MNEYIIPQNKMLRVKALKEVQLVIQRIFYEHSKNLGIEILFRQ